MFINDRDKVTTQLEFSSLQECLKGKWEAQELSPKALKKFKKNNSYVYFLVHLLWDFQQQNKRLPTAKDGALLLKLAKEWFTDIGVDFKLVSEDLIR